MACITCGEKTELSSGLNCKACRYKSFMEEKKRQKEAKRIRDSNYKSNQRNKKKIMVNPLDDSKDIGSYEEIRNKANKIRGKEVFPGYKNMSGITIK